MSYSTSTPPQLMAGNPGSGGSLWYYTSTDPHATVDNTDYFSNGSALGMAVNDVVIVVDSSTPTCTIHRVSTVTAGGAATIGAATLA